MQWWCKVAQPYLHCIQGTKLRETSDWDHNWRTTPFSDGGIHLPHANMIWTLKKPTAVLKKAERGSPASLCSLTYRGRRATSMKCLPVTKRPRGIHVKEEKRITLVWAHWDSHPCSAWWGVGQLLCYIINGIRQWEVGFATLFHVCNTAQDSVTSCDKDCVIYHLLSWIVSETVSLTYYCNLPHCSDLWLTVRAWRVTTSQNATQPSTS